MIIGISKQSSIRHNFPWRGARRQIMLSKKTGFVGVLGVALSAGICVALYSPTPSKLATTETNLPRPELARSPGQSIQVPLSTPVTVEIRQPAPEEVRKWIEGSWYEIEIKDSGMRGYGGSEQFGWRFGPDRAENWTLFGELQTCDYGEIRLDTTVTPWRFDIIDKHTYASEKKHCVWAGIFECQSQDLVWVSNGDWVAINPGDPFPAAPIDFTSTKENKQIRRVLKRCEYLQTRFP
jgi:hypothetical protein